MSAVSAALLLGASSLAMAAQPGASDQGSTGLRSDSDRAPTTTGDVTTPKYDGKAGTSPSGNAAPLGNQDDHALSGTSTPPMDQAQVKQRLEQQGYSNVQGLHKDHNGWTANAERNGQKVTVNLDASGQVKSKTR